MNHHSPSTLLHSTRLWRVAVAVVGLLFLAGCGASDGGDRLQCVPVTGQVFWGATPAAGAQVSLIPEAALATATWEMGYPRGTVADDGSVVISTYKSGDGAPAGSYVIAVYWPITLASYSPDAEDAIEPPDRLYGKYSNPRQSTLRAVVEDQTTTLPPIDLSR